MQADPRQIEMTMPEQSDWLPTRSAGLARARAFQPAMGARYAKRRNFDLGPGAHSGVSTLSPWVRRRLLTERELVEMALAAHAASSAEKFVQEIFWRTYFKGWLEHRPAVWRIYRSGLAEDLDQIAGDRALGRRLVQAEEGRTGIACFDAWAEELVQTGYLHNHARMWFASIWVFTLGLPWRVGADFFLRHLLDGDPASNTLGWRWVCGLHTRGKVYEAKAWNIEKFTGGRFAPDARELASAPVALVEAELPPASPIRVPEAVEPDRPCVLLLHEDDCLAEDIGLDLGSFDGFATLSAGHDRSPREVAPAVLAFDAGALADAAERVRTAGLSGPGATLVGDRPHRLVEWAHGTGASQIITPFVPVGPVRDYLDRAAPELRSAGIRLAEVRRAWDSLTWPSATAGFFKVKARIPTILERLS